MPSLLVSIVLGEPTPTTREPFDALLVLTHSNEGEKNIGNKPPDETFRCAGAFPPGYRTVIEHADPQTRRSRPWKCFGKC